MKSSLWMEAQSREILIVLEWSEEALGLPPATSFVLTAERA
jgi:hypothetical protein